MAEMIVDPAGRRRRITARLATRPILAGAVGLMAVLVLAALFAPWIAPHDPLAQDVAIRLQGPSSAHWVGTDEFGRDELSRLIFGLRVSLLAAAEALVVSGLLGIPLGIVAGYLGGRLDRALSRLFDGLMSIPALILALTIVAVLGPGLTKAMLAVGVIFSPRYFRVTRAVTMGVRRETFIEASEALGGTRRYIVLRHVMPNVLAALIVEASIILGMAVTAEANLSFLGLGVEPPTASWGAMLTAAASNMSSAPHLVWAPGVMITVTVLAFTLLGEAVRGVFDVQATGRGSRGEEA